MIRSLLASTALAPLALFCVPANAQNVTGLQLGVIRSATQAQPCFLLRGPNICDPFGVLDLTTGAFTPPPLVIPYTNTMLNTNTDLFRVQIGNLPQSLEFPSLDPSGNSKTTAGIVSALAQPIGGTYTGGIYGWPDASFAAYAIGNQVNKAAVGYLGYVGTGIDGGFVQLFNGVASNKPLGVDSGNGFNAAHVNGIELDLKVYPLASGAMTGDVYAYQAFFDSPTTGAYASLSASAAFRALGFNAGKWNVAYLSEAGGANVFASIGAATSAGASDSQPISLNMNNGSVATNATIMGKQDGGISLAGSYGGTFLLRSAYPQLAYTQTVAGLPVGIQVSNPSTVAASQASFTWLTGSANSSASAVLTDNNTFNITTGSAINQIFIQAGGGSPSIALASPVAVGVTGTALGTMAFNNLTSGTVTLRPVTGALGSAVLSLPAATDTLVGKATTDIFTNKDLTSGTNTFPTFNQNTTGSAAKWTTPRLLAGNSVDGSANVAFANKFIVQGTADTGLSAAQFLGALSTGIVKNTTTTGVLSVITEGTGVETALGQNVSGSGSICLTTNCVMVTPTLGAATATTINGNTITTGTGTLTLAAAKTLTVSNTLTLAGTDGSTINVGAGGTLATGAFTAIGTSGATIPLLNGANTGSALWTFNAGLAVPVSAATAPTIDASGQTAISVANGGSGALAFDNMGMVVVTDINTGHTAIYIMLSGGANLVAMDSNWTTGTAPGAGLSSIAWNGSTFAVYNNTGATHGYKLVNFRTH